MTRHGRLLLILLCGPLIWGALALAGVTPTRTSAAPATPDPLAAVGWLGYGRVPVANHASCSGVLVAPDLVVTAAHCLVDGRTGQPRKPAALTFAAGWADGQAADSTSGAEVILPAPRRLLAGRLPYDLALLRLARPLSGVAPLRLAAWPAPVDARLTTLAYPQARPDRPERQEGCAVTLALPPVIGLGCRATGGYSGGAVLIATPEGGWQLQAVMVANANHSPTIGALALALPADLLARLPRP
jgi:protease YdgD